MYTVDLNSITGQLQKEFNENPNIEIQKQMQYAIPIHTLEVHYHPVMRNAMDILMKMMLISFQKAKLKNVELLAEILLVEPLFIHDLTNKMLRMGMIEKENEVFTLTAKGMAQLESGIFEEELEQTSHFVQYSPIHEQLLEGDLEEFADLEEFPEPFPAIENEEIEAIEESMLIEFIQRQLSEQPLSEQEAPTFITKVISTESIQINDIPVLCFSLLNQKQNRHFMRVYNTLTGVWDERLETILFNYEKEHLKPE
ncbi:nucleoside-diphosphate sugar epimerase [Solibacillus faecavium]|uniref:nucleoside-diphosphate sugar epimerase n=1 Tax=Solibacillus faecavium TaxID=2762221 RepID=UPI001CD8D67E|nr:nucleoside-diphosphate sugar epimerase [Solibacillus faecavium]